MELLYIHISFTCVYIENIHMKRYINTKYVQCFYGLIHQCLQNTCTFVRSPRWEIYHAMQYIQKHEI